MLAAAGALPAVVACRASGEPVAIRLDVHPFTDPSVTLVQVRLDGAAAVVRYSARAVDRFRGWPTGDPLRSAELLRAPF